MNRKTTIVIFIGCLLILTNFSIATSAVTISTKINKNSQNIVEKIDPKSIENTDSVTPETDKIVPTTEEKSVPTSVENKVTPTQQNEKNVITSNVPESGGLVVQPGNQMIPGQQQNVLLAKANAGGPYSGQMGETITFAGSSCYFTPITTYTWDFGDNNDQTAGSGRHPTHVYSANGIYIVTLKVTNGNDETYLDIAPVYIGQQGNNLVPRGGCNYQGQVNQQITFDASKSISINPNAYPLKYRWDFGDGEGYTAWSNSPISTHAYKKENVYQVKLEIKDKYGKTRHDVLHADIGCSLSSFRNFFLNTDGILDNLISLLYDNQGLGSIFCQWLDVKLYYKYNDYPAQTVPISSLDQQNFPIYLNVDNAGGNDVSVGSIVILAPKDGFRTSPFDPYSNSMQFESDLSEIKILPGSCIGTNDDLTICLQFTFPPFFVGIYQTYLGINLDPTVRIGCEFEAGKQKPTENEPVSVIHYFRPYLLECLQHILTGESSQPQDNPSPNEQSSDDMTLNTQTETQQYSTYIPSYGSAVQEIPQETDLTANSDNLNINAQAQQTQPINPDDGVLNVYPEHGIAVYGDSGESLSIIASVSTNDGYTITFKTTFDSLFSPFLITHRRGETLRDVDISGSDPSAITFSITGEGSSGSATLGMTINPAQHLGLHVNIDRTGVERHATLNIDNPPENVILFIETENAQGEQAGHYFYMKKIPNSLDLSWVPSLADGHVQITRDSGSDGFEVGFCNDLINPDNQVFLSNIPTTFGLAWQISLDDIKSITLSSETSGLTLNAELKDVTQPNQKIDFIATIDGNLDLAIKWNPQEGYFAIDRSATTINFNFVLTQEHLILNIGGDYTSGDGDGLKFVFNNFQNNVIEIDSGRTLDLNVLAVDPDSQTTLKTDLLFEQNGYAEVNWSKDLDYLKFDSKNTIKLDNFDLSNSKFSISADEIKLENEGNVELNWDQTKNLTIDTSSGLGLTLNNFDLTSDYFGVTSDEIQLASNSALYLSNNEYDILQLSGSNQITLNNFEGHLRYWSSSIGYAKSIGNFDIVIKPLDKYYNLNMQDNLELDSFNVIYDSTNDQYDTNFGMDSFNMEYGGGIWFNFSSATPKFDIQGSNQLNLDNLHFKIGPDANPTVDFSISSFGINGVGEIYSEINSQHFLVLANVNFNWIIAMQSLNYGNWQVNGTYSGSGTMNLTEFQPGQSGQVAFTVNSPIHHNLKIIHDQLTLDLGNVTLNQGSVTFKWKREQSFSNGYFNVSDTGVTGMLSLCKITYDTPSNPFEFEVGNLSVTPGNLYTDWQKQGDQKMFHINNGLTINLALIKLTWGDKTITLGDIGLTPGQFLFTLNTQTKTITLKNSMTSFGPLCTYEDADRKLSVDLVNLVSDYSKTMTLKWYEDSNNKIIGLYLDTDNTQLVDWITFTSIKYSMSGTTGRRIALGGFQADDFKIMKNSNDQLEFTGHLNLVNEITFSILVNPQTDSWQSLDLQWDLTSGLKWIKFNSDFQVGIKLASVELFGIHFTSEIDLTSYLEIKWNLSGDASHYKEFHFDTDGQTLSSISFTLLGPNNRGIEVDGGGIYADDFYVKWKLWPPLQADLIIGGTIGYESAEVYGTVDGSNWIEIWPWAGSPRVC